MGRAPPYGPPTLQVHADVSRSNAALWLARSHSAPLSCSWTTPNTPNPCVSHVTWARELFAIFCCRERENGDEGEQQAPWQSHVSKNRICHCSPYTNQQLSRHYMRPVTTMIQQRKKRQRRGSTSRNKAVSGPAGCHRWRYCTDDDDSFFFLIETLVVGHQKPLLSVQPASAPHAASEAADAAELQRQAVALGAGAARLGSQPAVGAVWHSALCACAPRAARAPARPAGERRRRQQEGTGFSLSGAAGCPARARQAGRRHSFRTKRQVQPAPARPASLTCSQGTWRRCRSGRRRQIRASWARCTVGRLHMTWTDHQP